MTNRSVRLENDPLWYQDAVIYELHVKAFQDSNGDGIGDFAGLTQRIDYIQDLGVNTVWLLPFYPSPMRDDGYDISDYRNVHLDFGTRKDFASFVREAHRRGIRVITELVVNHTSDQHPWFQAARRAPPGSRKREYYIWSETVHKLAGTRIIFTDSETSNWAWDPRARAYYWHRFFSHQPDLNHNNPQVVKAIIRVMRFWLDLGVDGLRLDAVPYLCVREGTSNENLPETHAVIKQMRAVIDAHYANRMFLAEANQWPEDVRDYFGDGDECHMAYHFPLMPRMYMAVAQEDRHPITEILAQTPEIPANCQWAVFLRNHDELTLEMVTDRERDYLYQVFAVDPRMRLNLGIRRRLAPLMDNDPDRIKLMNSLLMSMPGSPIVYYGDEIGMGDNFYLGDRNGVRTPMQWSPDRNAGFSRADPQRLYLPPIMDPIYGYQAVNVEAQLREPSSLLNWMRRLIAVRKANQAFGRGTIDFLHPGNRKILAYVRQYRDQIILCAANLSGSAQPVELELSRFRGHVPVELLGGTPFPRIGELPYLLTLAGHGFYWFRLAPQAEVPSWHAEQAAAVDLPVLVVTSGWTSFFPQLLEPTRRSLGERLRAQLEREVLPAFLSVRRWFDLPRDAVRSVAVTQQAEWQFGEHSWILARLQVALATGETRAYFLPLSILWGSREEEALRAFLPHTLARVRQQARMGILYDAFADDAFCAAVVRAMGEGLELSFGDGALEFTSTRAYARLAGDLPAPVPVRRPGGEGSGSVAILGDRLFLKGYRRLHEGVSPELEIGCYLAEASPPPNVVPIAGALQYRATDGTLTTLALLQAYVSSQGDGWTYTQAYLDRFLRERRAPSPEVPAAIDEAHAVFRLLMQTLGRRVAELHLALARPSTDPRFAPEPVEKGEPAQWAEQVVQDARTTLQLLTKAYEQLPPAQRAQVERVAAHETRLVERLRAPALVDVGGLKTRVHGDLQLGQVLQVENDFYIVALESEPVRELPDLRAKQSPLQDVAGMLRSFDYATRVALARHSAERPEDTGPLASTLWRWEEIARQAFLDTYLETVGASPVLPSNPEHTRWLLELFTLERVLQEIRYELAHRPDWLGIPLGGLETLLQNGLLRG